MSQEWRLALSSGSSRKVSAMFFRFLDGRGYMIDPPESMQRQLGMPLAKRRLEQRFAKLQGVLNSPERQQIGYMDVARELTNQTALRAKAIVRGKAPRLTNAMDLASSPELQEIIITKIGANQAGQPLGAIVLGFPLPELIPQTKGTNRIE